MAQLDKTPSWRGPKSAPAFYAALAAITATGLVYWVAKLGWAGHGEFGGPPAWAGTAGAVHGACAMLALVSFGAVLGQHAARYRNAGRNRLLGFSMLALFVGLIVTSYLLYYASNDALRAVSGTLHWILGLLLPLLFAGHVASARRSAR
jgi:hypothetical protein